MKQAVAVILDRAREHGYEDVLDVPKNLFSDWCSEPCFDIKGVGKRLCLNNRGTQVLNAHLALDHVLTMFLNDQFISYAPIKTERISFNQKADLLYSLGCLSEPNYRWAKRLNKLRNKLAHELDFKVSNAEVVKFIDFFEDLDEQGLLERRQFAHALLLIVLGVENDRIKSLHHDVQRHLAMLNARKVLAETTPEVHLTKK